MATVARARPPAVGMPYARMRPAGTIIGGGKTVKSVNGFNYQYYDELQVPTILEQPKLIFYGAAQPFYRPGHQRNVRTRMAAGARFLGRWIYVGYQMAQFRDRGKTAGVQNRPWTYQTPMFQTGPGPSRTVRVTGPTVGRQ